MPLEKVLMNMITVKFRRPQIRVYETDNLYERPEILPAAGKSRKRKKGNTSRKGRLFRERKLWTEYGQQESGRMDGDLSRRNAAAALHTASQKEERYVRDRDEYSADHTNPDVYERPLTRREQKQKEKLEKQAEAIRQRQEALEQKRRKLPERRRRNRPGSRQSWMKKKQKRAKQEEKEARERANRKQSRQRTKPGLQRKGREQARAQAPALPPNREAIPEKAGKEFWKEKRSRGRQRKEDLCTEVHPL